MAWLGRDMAIALSQLVAVAADGILAIEATGDRQYWVVWHFCG